jgi:DNA-binding PadR family transcriptional regulator
VETGSLYPALHRLEKQGWIKSEWRTSEHNQRAKYYQLTAAGKKQLVSEHSRWNQMIAAIRSLMSPGESEGQA